MLYCSLSLIDICDQEVFRANVKYYNNAQHTVGTKQWVLPYGLIVIAYE